MWALSLILSLPVCCLWAMETESCICSSHHPAHPRSKDLENRWNTLQTEWLRCGIKKLDVLQSILEIEFPITSNRCCMGTFFPPKLHSSEAKSQKQRWLWLKQFIPWEGIQGAKTRQSQRSIHWSKESFLCPKHKEVYKAWKYWLSSNFWMFSCVQNTTEDVTTTLAIWTLLNRFAQGSNKKMFNPLRTLYENRAKTIYLMFDLIKHWFL